MARRKGAGQSDNGTRQHTPCTTAFTPSGVPVKIRSPGCSAPGAR